MTSTQLPLKPRRPLGSGLASVREILERKHAELMLAPRDKDSIAGERSADPMDEIRAGMERDLDIESADRKANLLRDVRAALQRQHEGSFGTCIECDSGISPKRLAAMPWAPRCIRCQEAADSAD